MEGTAVPLAPDYDLLPSQGRRLIHACGFGNPWIADEVYATRIDHGFRGDAVYVDVDEQPRDDFNLGGWVV